MQEPAASEVIYRGAIVTLRVETVPEPIGGTRRFEIVEHAEAVAVVAIRPGGHGSGGEPEVALVRQMRPAVRRELWEIPAGVLDPEERGTPERAASRELTEETGYRASVWRLVAHVLPSPGFTTERIAIFLASGVQPAEGMTGGAPADASEIAAVRWAPLSEALRMCREGEIEDGKTIAGLYLAHDALAVGTTGGTGPGVTPGPEGALPGQPTGSIAPATDATGGKAAPERDPRLSLEKMLIEEFKYARETAAEAIEDRGRMFDRYLVLVGGILAAGVGAMFQLNQIGAGSFLQPLAVGIFLVAGVLGAAFFATLVRLRGAYRDSLLTMNTIKEYYIREFRPSVRDVHALFRWRQHTLPKHERYGSVWYLTAHIVAVVGSLCFGVAALIGLELSQHGNSGTLLPSGQVSSLAALGVFVVAFALHRWYFARKTTTARPETEKATAERAAELGI